VKDSGWTLEFGLINSWKSKDGDGESKPCHTFAGCVAIITIPGHQRILARSGLGTVSWEL
jgi:hypothetical protein